MVVGWEIPAETVAEMFRTRGAVPRHLHHRQRVAREGDGREQKARYEPPAPLPLMGVKQDRRASMEADDDSEWPTVPQGERDSSLNANDNSQVTAQAIAA
jgi:hypothetical protein